MSNYTVKKGDGWYKIAKNLGVNVNDLLKANNATLDTQIHPGQILKSSNKLVAKSDKQYKHMDGLQMDWKSYGDEQQAQQNEFKDKFITPTLQKVTKMSKQADKEINRYNSRKKQLLAKHKNDPIPLNTYKNKADISKLQDQLHSLGYLKGSYNRAVDGVWGKATQAAYDAAVNDGIFNKKDQLTASKDQSQGQPYMMGSVFGLSPQANQQIKNAISSDGTPDINTTNLGQAIYLHYPNFKGQAANALKINNVDVGKEVLGDGNVLPVGHDEVLLVSPERKVKYVRYGRYTSGTGHVRNSKKGGNWGIYNYPDMKPNETTEQYINRLQKLGKNYLEDSKYGKFEVVDVPNVDYNKALQYATTQANDSNRKEYSVTNTCATGACNVVEAGLSNADRAKMNQLSFSTSGADNDLATTLWGLIPGSTNYYTNKIRNLGKSYIVNK